jgi:hypothetical protein
MVDNMTAQVDNQKNALVDYSNPQVDLISFSLVDLTRSALLSLIRIALVDLHGQH